MINQNTNDNCSYEATLCEIIQILRKFNGINQKDMAQKIGISYPTYWRMENNLTNFSFTIFRSICISMEYAPLTIFEIAEKVWVEKQQDPQVKVNLLLFKELFLNNKLTTTETHVNR